LEAAETLAAHDIVLMRNALEKAGIEFTNGG